MPYKLDFKILDTDGPLIERLSPKHQDVLRVAGSYREIATLLGIASEGTVKSRLHRARVALVELREKSA